MYKGFKAEGFKRQTLHNYSWGICIRPPCAPQDLTNAAPIFPTADTTENAKFWSRYFLLAPSYFFLSPWYFSLSAQKKFVTNLLTCITNFVICVTKFVTSVTRFVTKTFLYNSKNYQADSKNYLAESENYLAESRLIARGKKKVFVVDGQLNW